jgi:predicted amidohydrolase YtcJ
MKNFKYFLFILLLALLSSCKIMNQADWLFYDGKIYTANENFETFTAMAVKGDKIVDIGDADTLLKRWKAKEKINLQGKIIVPGIIDSHCHLIGYSVEMEPIDLTGVRGVDEMIERIQIYLKQHPDLRFIYGRGWDQNLFPNMQMPNNKLLNKYFPDIPVYLKRIDGHAALANDAALGLANINNETQIDNGIIQKTNGELTGILIDNAMELVEKYIPPLPVSAKVSSLLNLQNQALQYGITSINEAGINYDDILLLDSLQKENQWKLRVFGMLTLNDDNINRILKQGIYNNNKIVVRSVKLYADGALGSRGAYLLEPYSDDSNNRGILLLDEARFDSIAQLCIKYNYQIATHAIGDAAVSTIINWYTKYLNHNNDLRWRIEHCQIVNPSDISKFGQYRIIPSVQPIHAIEDMHWAQSRLGDRIANAYIYKDLFLQNNMIAIGTDFPVSPLNPFINFCAAVYRQNISAYPLEGFQPDQALNKEVALRGMTYDGAYANFSEKLIGSLEIGKKADFAIINNDILKATPQELANTYSIATFIDGEIVFLLKGNNIIR